MAICLQIRQMCPTEATQNHLPIGKHTCQTFSRSSWVGYDFSNLPSVFWFPSMRLVMSVHVDDLTLAGEASKHEGFWKTFQLHVNLDPPTEFGRVLRRDHRLAEKISSLLRHVLDHPSKVLYDPETEPLFLPLCWFYPIYRELLNTASRHKYMELRRAASGLVKVICRTVESRPGGKGKNPGRPRKNFFFFNRWLQRISRILAVLGYEGIKQATPVVLRCVPKESQVPIHYDLIHHNLCMTERMVHKREKRHNNTRKTKARKHQPTTKTNTHNQTQNHRQHRGET